MQGMSAHSIQTALQQHPSKPELDLAWTKSDAYFYRSIAAIQSLWQVQATSCSSTLSALLQVLCMC